MAEDKSQKTEKATPRKRRESRKEGQIAKSQDLYGWVAVLGGSFVIPLLISGVGGRLTDLFTRLPDVIARPEVASMHQVTSSLAVSVFGLLSVFLVGAMLLSIGVTLAQVGFVLSGKPLKPQPKRIDPIQGFKRLFSVRTAWQAATGVAKMSVVGLVSIPLLYGVARDLSGDMQFELRSAIAYVAGSTLAIVRITAVVGLVIALADYAFQRWRTDKDMMMSKHDVKQETKNTEGDPQVKARQRAIRMSASRNRMIATVGDADVVVTNPTHVAVALRYRPETGAPRVVARGADAVASRIRHEARMASVPIVESRPLARALYASCRVDEEIPRTLFEGVATVLAFVHRLRLHPSISGEHLLEVPVTWDPALSDLAAANRTRRRLRDQGAAEEHAS
ncbi:MAG: EscU/YscU/HrcU family type III secretion system export apparatus switch protein [Acidimicrobiales bacterium]|nr:EscU/YscU/HrcU family type III secretion system export apparatus switch protein [Acidimicrobiales bacterium]